MAAPEEAVDEAAEEEVEFDEFEPLIGADELIAIDEPVNRVAAELSSVLIIELMSIAELISEPMAESMAESMAEPIDISPETGASVT